MAPLQTRSLPHGIPTIYPSKKGKVKMRYKITFGKVKMRYKITFQIYNIEIVIFKRAETIQHLIEWITRTFEISKDNILKIEQVNYQT